MAWKSYAEKNTREAKIKEEDYNYWEILAEKFNDWFNNLSKDAQKEYNKLNRRYNRLFDKLENAWRWDNETNKWNPEYSKIEKQLKDAEEELDRFKSKYNYKSIDEAIDREIATKYPWVYKK